MKILFALSQIELTGAEVYAVTLAQALKKLGHEIVFVSDKIQSKIPFKFYSVPLHSKNNSYIGRIKNIFSIKKIIKEENIQLIHSHSRAANLVAHFAKGSLPMIATIHGRWRNHFAARALPCLGDRTIAVCPYLERYLIEDIQRPASTISMIPNGIDTEKLVTDTNFSEKLVSVTNFSEILFVGRFSGQKGNVIRFLLRDILPTVLKNFSNVTFRIVSTGALPLDHKIIEDLNKGLNRKAVLLDENGEDLATLYQNAKLIIGSGRVAIEGMACGRPVIAIGESSAPGILSPESFDLAFDSNFGDCGVWNLFLKENHLLAEITELMSNPNKRESLGAWGREVVLKKFDVTKIAKDIEKIYKSSLVSGKK